MNPLLSFRDYKLDLGNTQLNDVIEIAQTLAPVAALYGPLQMPLSCVTTFTQLSSHSISCLNHLVEGEYSKSASELFGITYTIASFGTRFFCHEGMKRVLAVYDLGKALYDLSQCPEEERTKQAFKIINQALYTAVLIQGGFGLNVAMFGVQTTSHLWEARSAYYSDKKLAAAASLILAGSSAKQTHKAQGSWKRCRRLCELRKNPVLKWFQEKVIHGEHVINPRFSEKSEQLTSKPGIHYLHGFGQDAVRNENLIIKNEDGKMQLIFRVPPVIRKQLEDTLKMYTSVDQETWGEFCDLLSLPKNSLSIRMNKKTKAPMLGTSRVHKIALKNMGSITIGSEQKHPLLYHQVTVTTERADYLPALLELLDLSQVLSPARPDDIERLKIWHLFRTFYPHEAYPMERDARYFFMTPKQLRDAIVKSVPDMKRIFSQDLPNMQAIETLPGRFIFGLNGIKNQAEQMGAVSLYATIGGANGSAATLLSILDDGMLSTDQRILWGMRNETGWSSDTDQLEGSADRVFTRLEVLNTPIEYYSDVTVHFSLDCLETGTYQYENDHYGTRVDQIYENRPTIWEFIGSQNEQPSNFNEVMIRDSIKPQWIQKVVFGNMAIREEVITSLRRQGKIRQVHGMECFRGKPIEDFFVLAVQEPELDRTMAA